VAVLHGREGKNDCVYAGWVGTYQDYNANDVGFVPFNAGHYVENTGDTDLVFLELFKASEVLDFSLNQWIRRLPPEMVFSHLKLDRNAIQTIPAEKLEIVPR
jgi:oxalate decarboxylase